ncbi:hypothetical protein GCM10010359_48190 [Streptomyces morookaense]|nr:hypothetical protein GCM10010359_48190 [Streptomyces morookaense]
MDHRIACQAVVIATGISATGQREILGVAVGDSESKAYWTGFLRPLRERGLDRVQLVVSDAYTGMVAAVRFRSDTTTGDVTPRAAATDRSAKALPQ